MNSLEEIAELVRSCTDCPLSEGRTKAVPGEGANDARVIFIGEAPGYQEDQHGRPFVGPAGRFLDELLASIGLKREDVFIANMIKCRPPNNRDPLPTEVAACTKYLDRQIELLQPDLIVTLGDMPWVSTFPRRASAEYAARCGRRTASASCLYCTQPRPFIRATCDRALSRTFA